MPYVDVDIIVHIIQHDCVTRTMFLPGEAWQYHTAYIQPVSYLDVRTKNTFQIVQDILG